MSHAVIVNISRRSQTLSRLWIRSRILDPRDSQIFSLSAMSMPRASTAGETAAHAGTQVCRMRPLPRVRGTDFKLL